MRYLRFTLTLLCLATILAACDSVRTLHPIGDPATSEDLQQLVGRYQMDKDMFQLQVVQDNQMRGGHLRWEDNRFEVQELEFSVGVIDTAKETFYLMNMYQKPAEGDERPPYDFLLVKQRDSHLIIWPANVAAFARAVRAEKLAGTIHDAKTLNVVLTQESQALTDYLKQADLSDYFEWHEPFFLVRMDP